MQGEHGQSQSPCSFPWRDDAKQEALGAQWLAFDAAGKAQIKNAVFGCLGSSARGARDVAAQVVSAAATIELPRGEWLDVIQALVTNVTSASTPQLKQSSLKVLGYICEEIDPDVLESQSNLILTAVIQGMRKAVSYTHLTLPTTAIV